MCPCGSGSALGECCGAILAGRREAATPEELMRSRYTANVVGDDRHLFRSWHPRTRPEQVYAVAGWTALEILDAPPVVGAHGVVEFVARHADGDLRERSTFERRRGRWVYVEGDVAD